MDPAGKQWITLAAMIVIALVVVVSDVVLAHTCGVDATYSRVAAHLFQKYPVVLAIVLFGLGCLTGHVLLSTYPR